MVKYVFAICILVMVGCTTVSEINREDHFKKTSYSYKQALQWGDWVAASGKLDSGGKALDYPAIDELKQIKVTSYEVNAMKLSEDKLQVQQTVEIQYYHINRMVEKTLIDKQVWEYDEEGGWRLVSGLPKF